MTETFPYANRGILGSQLLADTSALLHKLKDCLTQHPRVVHESLPQIPQQCCHLSSKTSRVILLFLLFVDGMELIKTITSGRHDEMNS